MAHVTKDLGVPAWVAMSCVRDRDTGSVIHGIEESGEAADAAEGCGPLAEAVREVMSIGGSVVLMMHSVRDVTEDAVRVQRGGVLGTGRCVTRRGLPDATEPGLRRPGISGGVPRRRQALGRSRGRARGRLLRSRGGAHPCRRRRTEGLLTTKFLALQPTSIIDSAKRLPTSDVKTLVGRFEFALVLRPSEAGRAISREPRSRFGRRSTIPFDHMSIQRSTCRANSSKSSRCRLTASATISRSTSR